MRSVRLAIPGFCRHYHGASACALALLIASSAFVGVRAQSNQNDPRVMGLYKDAKSAEQNGNFAEAVAKYKSILAIAPQIGPAYNNLGALYLKQHQYAKAIAILRQGLKVDPTMYSASVLLGITYYESGEYANARAPLDAALRSNPKDNNAELYLANDLIKLQDFNPAAAHLQELAKRDPNNQQVWYLLGNVYIQLSEQAFSKIDAIDPNSVLSHEVRGDVMSGMKNFDGALVEYKKAVDIAPHQPGTHYKLGDAYWQLYDWSDATEQFQAELANDPGNCNARWKLGDILLEQHMRPDEALADIDNALHTCPDLTQAKQDRATALIRLNRYGDAVSDLESALKSSPDEPHLHFLLAQAYRGMGKSSEAKAEMATFAKLEQSARVAEAKHAEEVMKQKSKIPDTQQP